MGLLIYLKGLITKLISTKDVKTALNIDVAVSAEMLRKIDEWQKCYAGNAPWLDESVKSLRLEQAIVRELSNIVLSEMEVDISNDKLQKIYNAAIIDLNENFQGGLATGAMVIKPLGDDKVQYVSQGSFIPVEYDSRGRLKKVIFPELKQIGNDYYTRLEYHSLDEAKGLEITNKAYYSTTKGTLGREIPLETVSDWAELLPYVNYPKMTRPAYGYYRNPIKNTIDGSFGGVSVFDTALGIIEQADKQYSNLLWEFESGQRAVHVSIDAIKGDGTLPKLNKRLYKGLDLETGVGQDLYEVFSPEFRETSIINGLEEYKRAIEFSCGLSYGDISNPQTIEKTATEIITSKKRKYNTVTAIQENLKECISDLVYALAFYNSMATSNYEVMCDFKDSILNDEDTQRQRDIQDLNLGIIRPEEYRAKWHNETIEQALENLPQSAETE